MEITNFKIYRDTEQNLKEVGASCIIDDVEHYTADIRFIGGNMYAVFSDITNVNNSRHCTKQGINDCVTYGLYQECNGSVITASMSHLISVKFKYDGNFDKE